MSLHVIVSLPDGRAACADYRQPVVLVMRRINRRIEEGPRCGDDIEGQAEDLALVAGWLDHHPEQACGGQGWGGWCRLHGPSTEPAKLPRRYAADWQEG